VDLIIVAQAFHWFDQAAAHAEFKRILRPNGLVAIIWNSRRLVGTPFLEGYEALLKEYGTDYTSVAERYGDEDSLRAWFGDGYLGMGRFDHGQWLDYDALQGRLMSSSYAPRAGHPSHEPMLHALRALFDRCQVDGRVSFDYDTVIYVGKMS
jgi:SAM-dependent methyltransferase